MVTKTDQERRFFDLASQAIGFVNQNKRSPDDIEWLNRQLQRFKERECMDCIWPEEDDLEPLEGLEVRIPEKYINVREYCLPYVGTIFNEPQQEEYEVGGNRTSQDIQGVSFARGRRYMAEIYQSKDIGWMDPDRVYSVARYRGRDLLGTLGAGVLAATHGERIMKIVPQTLWCLARARHFYFPQLYVVDRDSKGTPFPNGGRYLSFGHGYTTGGNIGYKDCVVMYRPI